MFESNLTDQVNSFLEKQGWGKLDNNNKCLIKKGNATVAIVAVPERNLLMVSSPVISLPEENLLPLFRKLLTLNFEETQDAFFAINEEVGTVDLQIKRPLKNLDQDEFVRAVEMVAEGSDKYNDILASDFGAEVVEAQIYQGGKWIDYLNAFNPLGWITRKTDLKSRLQKIRAVFAGLGLIASIGAAIYAYNRAGSWALAIFTYLWVQFVIARALPDLITDPYKIRRFIFFALHPAIAVAILYFTYQWWGRWWLSALLGYLGGMILARLIGLIIMPQIAMEEAVDEEERMNEILGASGG